MQHIIWNILYIFIRVIWFTVYLFWLLIRDMLKSSNIILMASFFLSLWCLLYIVRYFVYVQTHFNFFYQIHYLIIHADHLWILLYNFGMKSILSNISIDICLYLVSLWQYNFFHHFTFCLYVYVLRRWTSCRQHMIGCWLLIYLFSLFTWSYFLWENLNC